MRRRAARSRVEDDDDDEFVDTAGNSVMDEVEDEDEEEEEDEDEMKAADDDDDDDEYGSKRAKPRWPSQRARGMSSTPQTPATPATPIEAAATPPASSQQHQRMYAEWEEPKPKRGRGRPRKYPLPPEALSGSGGRDSPLEEPYPVVDDEYVIEGNSDPLGDAKVNPQGYLHGGREYRCRTFTALGRGSRLYMLSTEPARCLGYRDAYLMFLKYRKLRKVLIEEEEKNDLVERNIIPASYRGRTIALVTARSIFKEFGARIIVGGRRVIDDYWESEARVRGDLEGELADPDDKLPPAGVPYNRNQYVSWHASDDRLREPLVAAPARKRKRPPMPTHREWLYEHAEVTREFNSSLAELRRDGYRTGYYEPHTNLLMLPANTQPTRIAWRRVATSATCPVPRVDTCMLIAPAEGASVHLADVPERVLEDLDAKTLQAVRARQAAERAL